MAGDGYMIIITTDFPVIDDAGNVLGCQQSAYAFEC